MEETSLTYDEVMALKQDLDKMLVQDFVNLAQFDEILSNLSESEISVPILEKTGIGLTLNNLRRVCEMDELSEKAKVILKKWKKRIPSVAEPESTTKLKMETKAAKQRYSETNDPVRLKCREMLADALQPAHNQRKSLDAYELAAKCEDAIFAEFNTVNLKYKNRVKSRIMNLTDEKNPNLKEHVLSGGLSPERLAKLSSLEMASDELKKLRAEITKEGISEHQLALAEGGRSSMLKCPECLSNLVSYSDIQMKTDDELSPTFVECLKCAHRWKIES